MRAFIDTNIFIYASSSHFSECDKAKSFLKDCHEARDSFVVSWKIIYEYLRVVTHKTVFGEKSLSFALALENIQKFCEWSNVSVLQETSQHWFFMESLAQGIKKLRGNLVHDAHTVALMKEYDIKRIYTADADFRLFEGIEVVNPIQ